MTQAVGQPGGAESGAEPDRYVLLGIPDLQGAIRGKALRPAAFESALRDGATMTDLLLALDPVDAPIDTYTSFGIRSGAGDLHVSPEPETLHDLAWLPGWQVCLATPSWRDGRPCEIAVREVLRMALARMAEQGYEVRAAFEYELRLTDAEGRPLSSGISYSVGEITRVHAFLATLRPALDALDVELTAVHTEAGPGLIELNLAPAVGLRAADSAALLKLAVKEVAASLDLRASFMAKPAVDEEGSSGHIHFSCWADGRNAFADPDGGALSLVGRAALAGILEHLPAASLALNPTLNSYKRVIPGWFAPVNVSWGEENRSAALRAIGSFEHPERSRIECRRPGADANPYVALAVLIAAATEGLQRGAEPPLPIDGDAADNTALTRLPDSLEEALAAWRADVGLRDALGPAFSDYYATSREWELRAWQRAVTDWERDRYERAV